MIEHREERTYVGRDSAVTVITEGHINNYVKNIGQHGLLCYTKKYINELTLLDMKFQFPRCTEGAGKRKSQAWIECQGVVIRCEPVQRKIKGDEHYEVAVYFSKISEKNKIILAEYVDKYEKTGS